MTLAVGGAGTSIETGRVDDCWASLPGRPPGTATAGGASDAELAVDDLWTVDVMTAGKSGIEPVELGVGPRHACVHIANVPVTRQHLYEHVTRRAAGKFDRDPWMVLSELNNVSVGSGRCNDRDGPSVGATC